MPQPMLADGDAIIIGREAVAGTRPATGYRKLQVNNYDGFHGENIEVDRNEVLDPNLTQERGEVIGYNVKPQLKLDLTDDVLDTTRELAFRTATKHSGGTGVSEFLVSAVTNGAPSSWTVPAGGALPAGTLVKGFNMANAANNGLHVVAAGSDATHVKTADALVTEVIAANGNQFLVVCGFQGLAADITIDATGNILSTAQDFTLLGLNPGQMLVLGEVAGDAYTPPLAGPGYGFISGPVTAHKIPMTRPTYVVGVDAAAAKTVRIRYKSMNVNVALDPTGGNGYLPEPTATFELSEPGASGATDFTENGRVGIDKMTIDIPAESKVSVSIEMKGCSRTDPSNARGAGCATALPPIRTGIYTTAAKMLGLRMLKQSDGTAFNAEVNAITLTINNGITANPALTRAGAAYLCFGGYMPSLTFKDIYLHDNDLVRAANNNVDVVVDFLMKSETGGFGFYFPMTKVRKPKKTATKGQAVKLGAEVTINRDPATGILWTMSQFGDLP